MTYLNLFFALFVFTSNSVVCLDQICDGESCPSTIVTNEGDSMLQTKVDAACKCSQAEKASFARRFSLREKEDVCPDKCGKPAECDKCSDHAALEEGCKNDADCSVCEHCTKQFCEIAVNGDWVLFDTTSGTSNIPSSGTYPIFHHEENGNSLFKIDGVFGLVSSETSALGLFAVSIEIVSAAKKLTVFPSGNIDVDGATCDDDCQMNIADLSVRRNPIAAPSLLETGAHRLEGSPGAVALLSSNKTKKVGGMPTFSEYVISFIDNSNGKVGRVDVRLTQDPILQVLSLAIDTNKEVNTDASKTSTGFCSGDVTAGDDLPGGHDFVKCFEVTSDIETLISGWTPGVITANVDEDQVFDATRKILAGSGGAALLRANSSKKTASRKKADGDYIAIFNNGADEPITKYTDSGVWTTFDTSMGSGSSLMNLADCNCHADQAATPTDPNHLCIFQCLNENCG